MSDPSRELFQTLHLLEAEQVAKAATSLANGGCACILVDPSGVYILIQSAPCLGSPYRVSFICFDLPLDKDPTIENITGYGVKTVMTVEQRDVLLVWARHAIPAVCTAWQKLVEPS